MKAAPVGATPAPVSLHVVCFRYVGRRNVSAEQLDAWNRELLCRLHESGEAVPSYTTVLRLGREIAAGS